MLRALALYGCGCERTQLSTGGEMQSDLFLLAGIVLCALGLWWWGAFCFWLSWIASQREW